MKQIELTSIGDNIDSSVNPAATRNARATQGKRESRNLHAQLKRFSLLEQLGVFFPFLRSPIQANSAYEIVGTEKYMTDACEL
ncbi:hypothetical protein DPMN_088477 [Dreissena polymorpha]|uniref:Uncharacterized protein n=1 Tax=Dreissena polymorpha TaxID=45954 RepID=A0A9D4QWJ5_DREPO|nr:hypothetical protein DPMN_088477 [Dreissena polymorpha]